MTKNQVNYLLALATLVVVWLYFNTFFEGAMAHKKATGFGRMPASMMEGGSAPFMPRSYRTGKSGMPSLEELKKMAAARMPTPSEIAKNSGAKVPTAVVPEKK